MLNWKCVGEEDWNFKFLGSSLGKQSDRFSWSACVPNHSNPLLGPGTSRCKLKASLTSSMTPQAKPIKKCWKIQLRYNYCSFWLCWFSWWRSPFEWQCSATHLAFLSPNLQTLHPSNGPHSCSLLEYILRCWAPTTSMPCGLRKQRPLPALQSVPEHRNEWKWTSMQSILTIFYLLMKQHFCTKICTWCTPHGSLIRI